MSKLSVNLVVYNGEKYLPFVFASLKRQTYKDWEMIFVDNCSTDRTMELLEKELADKTISCKILKNDANYGFASGHNRAFKEAESEYVLMLNVDMYLLPDALQNMVNFMDQHPQTGAVGPRLMRWDFERARVAFAGGSNVAEAATEGFTSDIDAIGIRLFRNRRAVEWLTRQRWAKDSDSQDVRNIYNKPVQEVFGVSGALPMYRKELIKEILLPGENIFDPTYHSYKEDLDLAYRLRNAGYVSYILLNTAAYHDRTGAGPKKMSDLAAVKNKARQSLFVSYHSYKNHLRTLYKNEYWQNFLLDFPFIFWYELKKFLFFLFTNPLVLVNSWKEILKNISYTRSARRKILATRKMYWRGIRRWM